MTVLQCFCAASQMAYYAGVLLQINPSSKLSIWLRQLINTAEGKMQKCPQKKLDATADTADTAAAATAKALVENLMKLVQRD